MTRFARRALSLTATAVVLSMAACSGSDDRASFDVEAGPTTTVLPPGERPASAPTPMPSADPAERYRFRRVALTGGGWVTGITIHATAAGVRYARSDVGGAYRWDESTRSWSQMLDATSVPDGEREPWLYNVESIAVAPSDPDVVYLGVGNDPPSASDPDAAPTGRVMRSEDGGRSWTTGPQRFPISGNGDHRQQTARVAVDPFAATTIIVGTRAGEIWRSVDGGGSFEPTDVPGAADVTWQRESPGVTFVVADPDGSRLADGGAAEWYAGVGGSFVLHSTDGGASWEVIRSLGPGETTVAAQVVDGTLYAARRGHEDGAGAALLAFDGSAWRTFGPPTGGSDWSLAVDPSDALRMIAADDVVGPGRVFVTFDGGESWADPDVTTSAPDAPWIAHVDDGSSMAVGQLAVDPSGDRRVWFADGNGVWEADLDADLLDWQFRGAGIDALVVADMMAPPGSPALITAAADAQGFRHVDPDVTPSAPLIDDDFAGGVDLDYAGTLPRAMAWIGAEYHLDEQYRNGRAARSPDAGETWRELDGVGADMYGGNVAMAADDPDNMVWVPSDDAADAFLSAPKPVYVTHDGGNHWEAVTSIGTEGGLHRLVWWFGRQALTADKVEPRTFYVMDDRSVLVTSVDGGTTWRRAPHAPPCTEDVGCHVFGALRADPRRGGVLWASVGSGGLYRSDDAGSSPWRQIDGVDEVRSFGFGAPLPGSEIPVLYLHGRARGDTADGIWRSSDDGATFELVTRFPGSLFAGITVVTGDMRVPGRVYVGFAGVGAVYGDDPVLALG